MHLLSSNIPWKLLNCCLREWEGKCLRNEKSLVYHALQLKPTALLAFITLNKICTFCVVQEYVSVHVAGCVRVSVCACVQEWGLILRSLEAPPRSTKVKRFLSFFLPLLFFWPSGLWFNWSICFFFSVCPLTPLCAWVCGVGGAMELSSYLCSMIKTNKQ